MDSLPNTRSIQADTRGNLGREGRGHMTKRLIGTTVFACALLLLVLGVFSSSSTQASAPTASVAGVKQAPQAAGQAASKPAKVQAINTWVDITPFPTITLSPTPGSFPLKLKRAGAA